METLQCPPTHMMWVLHYVEAEAINLTCSLTGKRAILSVQIHVNRATVAWLLHALHLLEPERLCMSCCHAHMRCAKACT